MTQEQKDEITKISKEFAKPFQKTIGGINGSGWLIVDPLAGYLNFCGFANKLHEIPATEKHPQVLIIRFKGGDQFIPAGRDLNVLPEFKGVNNWQWL